MAPLKAAEEDGRALLASEDASGSELAAPVDLNKDTFSFPVALHLHGKPWYIVLPAAVLGVAIFVIELAIIKWYVDDVMFKTIVDASTTVMAMHWFFVLVNWGAFQIPQAVNALKLLELDSYVARFFGAIELLSLALAAYFSATIIRAASEQKTVVVSYLSLRVALSFDDTVMMGITALLRYYLGEQWLQTAIEWEVVCPSASHRGKFRPLVRMFRPILPILLLSISLMRFLETTGPLRYVFPLGEDQFKYDLLSSLDGFSYTPRQKGDNFTTFMEARCARQNWLAGDGVPRVPASEPFQEAAMRVDPMLARASMVCQPKYALVPEPLMAPALLNAFARFLPPLSMPPLSGHLRSKYIPKGWPGNKDGDSLGVPACGICQANDMQCIAFDNAECDAAAGFLGAAAIPGPVEKLAVQRASQALASSPEGLSEKEVSMKPIVALLSMQMCHARPKWLIQGRVVRWHICELPQARPGGQ